MIQRSPLRIAGCLGILLFAVTADARELGAGAVDVAAPSDGRHILVRTPTNTSKQAAADASGQLIVVPGAAATTDVNLVKVGGSTHSATVPVHSRLTDGTTNYDAAKTGQLPSALGAQASAGSLSIVPSTTATFPATDNGGSLTTDPGVGFGIPFATETGVTAFAPVASTGATAAMLVALTAAQIIYPTTLICTNEDATTDEIVEILSSVVPTVLMRFYLPAKATFVYDGRGDIRTVAGEALQFRLADAGTTVKCSGSAIKR